MSINPRFLLLRQSIKFMTDVKLQTFPNLLIPMMLKLFARYTSVGMINTIIHWLVFALFYYSLGSSQALSNLAAFALAVSFSFFVNARFTFNSATSTIRYLLYVGLMGALSAFVGLVGDLLSTPAMLTVVAFSAISLVIGFLYAKFIVFNDK